jgi:alpha-amylase
VHLFEWSWDDVAAECEQFLGPKGFNAVQVSPPNEHVTGPQWWTRYQPVSYQLQSRSGNATAFADMVARCKKAGVAIYADAVINHMAAGAGTGVAGTGFSARNFPGTYGPQDFHHTSDTSTNCAVKDYDDAHNVQYCDLDGLPDLCTGCDAVRGRLAGYLHALGGAGAAGVRIDAAKHQAPSELGPVLAQGAGGMFVFQEVIYGAGEAVQPSQYSGIGHVTEFRFASGALAGGVKADGQLAQLPNLVGQGGGWVQSESAVVFTDNHDTQRGGAPLTYKDGALYTFANLVMLAWPYGYPKVMSSYYFQGHDQGPPATPVHEGGGGQVRCGDGSTWVCEHRTPGIANMVAWRREAGSAPIANWVAPAGDQIAFSRNGRAFAAFNRNTGASFDATLQTGLPAGVYCNVIASDDTASCPTVQVGHDGTASFSVPTLSAVALHAGAVRLYA